MLIPFPRPRHSATPKDVLIANDIVENSSGQRSVSRQVSTRLNMTVSFCGTLTGRMENGLGSVELVFDRTRWKSGSKLRSLSKVKTTMDIECVTEK